MKTKLTALALSAVTALSFSPKPAKADDKGLALLGGFIGGIIVASAINDSNHHDAYYSDRATTVVVNDRCDDRGPSGYWNVVAVNVWVPGCWVESRGYNGYRTRHFVSGHYERRSDRVWVSNNRNSHNDRDDRRDRPEREVSSGYGHDRNHR